MQIFNFVIVTVQYFSHSQTLGNGEGKLSKFSNLLIYTYIYTYEYGLQILWVFLKSL